MNVLRILNEIFTGIPENIQNMIETERTNEIPSAQLRNYFFDSLFPSIKLDNSSISSIKFNLDRNTNNLMLRITSIFAKCTMQQKQPNLHINFQFSFPKNVSLTIEHLELSLSDSIVLTAEELTLSKKKIETNNLNFSIFSMNILENFGFVLEFYEMNESLQNSNNGNENDQNLNQKSDTKIGLLKLFQKKVELNCVYDTIFALYELHSNLFYNIDIDCHFDEVILHFPKFNLLISSFTFKDSLLNINKMELKTQKHFYKISNISYSKGKGVQITDFESDLFTISLPILFETNERNTEDRYIIDEVKFNGEYEVLFEILHFLQSDFIFALSVLPQRCNTNKISIQINKASLAGIQSSIFCVFDKGFSQFVLSDLVFYTDIYPTKQSIPVITKGTIELVRENDGSSVIFNTFVNIHELRITIDEIEPLFLFCKKFLVFFIHEQIPMVNFNVTPSKIILCTKSNQKKHQILRISIKDFITSFSTNSNILSAKIPLMISSEWWNPITSFWDSFVEEFPCDISITQSFKEVTILASVRQEIIANISTQMLQKLKDIMKKNELRTESVFLSNELNTVLNISVDGGEIFQLNSNEIKDLGDATTESFIRVDLYETIFNVVAIDNPMFISPHYAIVPDSYKGGKLIRFCSRYSLRNNIPTDIYLFMDDKEHNKSQKILIETGKKHPIPPDFFDANFSIQLEDQMAETILSFKLSNIPKRYKVSSAASFIDCFFSIEEDPVTLCNIITIDCPLLFENITPFQVTCSFTIGESTRVSQAEPFQTSSVQITDSILSQQNENQMEIMANIPGFGFSSTSLLPFLSKTLLSFPDGSNLFCEMTQLESSQLKVTLYPSIIFHSFFTQPLFYGTVQQVHPISKGYGMVTLPNSKEEDQNHPTSSTQSQEKNKLSNEYDVCVSADEERTSILELKGGITHTKMLETEFESCYVPIVISFGEHERGIKEVIINPRISIENDLDVDLTFSFESPSLNFSIPARKSSDATFSNKDFLYTITCDYGSINNMFLINPLVTVFRFRPDPKMKRKETKEEAFILLEIVTENQTSKVRFSYATMPAPFVLINNLEEGYDIYAQQEERSFPIKISPQSCSIVPFDAPFSEPVLMITIAGKSQLLQLNRSYAERISFPFRIGSGLIFFEMHNVTSSTRALTISTTFPEEDIEKLIISFSFDIKRLSISFFDNSMFEFLLLTFNKVFLDLSTEPNYERSLVFSIESAQIDDQQSFSKSGVIMIGSNVGREPFIKIRAHFDKHLKSLNSLHVKVQPMTFSICSSFLSDLLTYFKDYMCLLEMNPNMKKVYALREIEIEPITMKLLFLQMNKRIAHYDKNYTPLEIEDCRCSINICSLKACDAMLSPYAIQDMFLNHIRRYFNIVYSRLHKVEPTAPNSIPFSKHQANLIVSESSKPKTDMEIERIHHIAQIKANDVFPVLNNSILTYLEYTDTSSTVLVPSISDQLSPETRNIGQRLKNQKFFCRKCITAMSDNLISAAIILKKQLYQDKRGDKLVFLSAVGDKDTTVAAITTSQLFLILPDTKQILAKLNLDLVEIKRISQQRLCLNVESLPNGTQGGEIFLDFETSLQADKFLTIFHSTFNQLFYKI